MIYIVTMLIVFSAGIAILMVIYMKKEQVEEECLDAGLNNSDSCFRGRGRTRSCTRTTWTWPGLSNARSNSPSPVTTRGDRYSEYINRGNLVNKLALQVRLMVVYQFRINVYF